MNQGEQPSKERTWALLAAIFLASFSLIAFEITLSRLLSVLLSYHYSFIVLSIAVLGLGLGGISAHFLRPWLGKGASPVFLLPLLSSLFAIAISFSVISIIQISRHDSLQDNTFFYGFLSWIPFFFAGMLLAECFRRFSKISGKIYGADLVGAAAGSLSVIQLLNKFGGVSTGFLLGGLASGAALLFAMGGRRETKKEWILSMGVLLILFILCGANLTGFYQPDIPIGRNTEKEIHDALYRASGQGKIIETRWSAFGRTDLVAFSNEADHMDIYIDGTAGSPMYKFNGDLNNPDSSLKRLKATFPGYLPLLSLRKEEMDHALIIGPGGGRDVLLALMAGVRKITAVEINRELVDIVRNHSTYNGGVYSNPGRVETVIAEGRHFLRRQKERYDLIMLSLPVTNTSRSLEGYALTENFLFTTDSIEDYLDRLKDHGRLVVIGHNDAEILRLLSISLVTLGKRGVPPAAAMKQMYILGSDLYPVFVMKKTPFDPEEIYYRFQALEKYGLDPVSSYFPYLKQAHALNPVLMQLGNGELSLGGLQNMVKERGYDISPVSDDRPFFYKIERGLPDSVSVVVWTSMLIWFLIVLVTLIYRKRGLASSPKQTGRGNKISRNPLETIIFFSLLGVGFMLVEISLIQRLTLFLGHPVIALSVLLFSLLGWAGIGSFWSGRLPPDKIDRGITFSSLSAGGLILVYTFVIPLLLDKLFEMDLLIRLFALVVILAPLGFGMGFPFPLGIRWLREKKMNDHIPWMWGINGAGSVLGSVMTITIAISYGYTLALLAGAGCYFIVFFLFFKKG